MFEHTILEIVLCTVMYEYTILEIVPVMSSIMYQVVIKVMLLTVGQCGL